MPHQDPSRCKDAGVEVMERARGKGDYGEIGGGRMERVGPPLSFTSMGALWGRHLSRRATWPMCILTVTSAAPLRIG